MLQEVTGILPVPAPCDRPASRYSSIPPPAGPLASGGKNRGFRFPHFARSPVACLLPRARPGSMMMPVGAPKPRMLAACCLEEGGTRMKDPFDVEGMRDLWWYAKYIAMAVRNAMEDSHLVSIPKYWKEPELLSEPRDER